MDGSGRALDHALAAELALLEIDVGHIVLNLHCPERTGLLAFAAADAGRLAGLAGDSALLHVHAGDENAAVLRSLVPQFDDTLRTCLHTGSAGSTLLLVHDRKPCLRIHGKSTELAGCHAVPASEASVETPCITAVESGFHLA